MDDRMITRGRIDELLRFLPLVSGATEATKPTWTGSEGSAEDRVHTFLHPVYSEAVEDFFRLAAQECWCDLEYDPARAAEMLQSDCMVAEASLSQIKSMLTFCVRGERFCGGHWAAVIAEGRITAILRRLGALSDSVPESDQSARGGASA